MEITWEIFAAIVLVTAMRVAWIAIRPLPHDVQLAIMSGLRRIRKVLTGEVKVEGNAPYGIIWYGMNLPIARLIGYEGRKWMISLALVDSLFLWLSAALGVLGFLAYSLLGTFQLFRAPWNVTINWLILLGILYWWFLLVAPIAKLPVGLPLHSFGDTRRGFFYQHNFVYYGLLGTLWLTVFFTLFVGAIRDVSLYALGFLWLLLLGWFYLQRKSRASVDPKKTSTSPTSR